MAGCGGSNCACKIVGGDGVRVSGSGNFNNPYIIDAYPMSITVVDTSTVNLTLTGSGTSTDPYVLSGDMTAGVFGDYWKKWSGLQTAYNAIGTKDAGTLYGITG